MNDLFRSQPQYTKKDRKWTHHSSLYKLLTAILNKRIASFCEENNILSKAQLGFVRGNRCSDGHFILHNLIKDYCHENGKWLYSCFVDFSKAFDCIPRDILFERLKSKGITGKVFNLIKKCCLNLYIFSEKRFSIIFR